MTDKIPHTKLPIDIANQIFSSPEAKVTWDSITPLARNEWICFLTSAKTEKGQNQRIERARNQLSEGHKRPCCWPGCPHRNPNAAKYFK